MCHRASKPVCRNYWAHVLHLENSPHSPLLGKKACPATMTWHSQKSINQPIKLKYTSAVSCSCPVTDALSLLQDQWSNCLTQLSSLHDLAATFLLSLQLVLFSTSTFQPGQLVSVPCFVPWGHLLYSYCCFAWKALSQNCPPTTFLFHPSGYVPSF